MGEEIHSAIFLFNFGGFWGFLTRYLSLIFLNFLGLGGWKGRCWGGILILKFGDIVNNYKDWWW